MNNTGASCPWGQAGDTPLAIASAIAGLLTFAYAVGAGFYVFYRNFDHSRTNFRDTSLRFDLYRQELEILGPQALADGLNNSGPFYAELEGLRNLELERIDLLFRDVRKQFDKTRASLDSLEKSALRVYDRSRGSVNLFDFEDGLAFVTASVLDLASCCTYTLTTLWNNRIGRRAYNVLHWCILPFYAIIFLFLQIIVSIINALDIKWLIGMGRLMAKQEELMGMMRKSEELFREARADTLNRRTNQIHTMTEYLGRGIHGRLSHLQANLREIAERLGPIEQNQPRDISDSQDPEHTPDSTSRHPPHLRDIGLPPLLQRRKSLSW
ncbi:hypothetical protein CONLIGDRAFT_706716 [Coniochaeta ligniaria NRRL 30616]|uniref:Uncharacterized protein n=1 Tax=Coniochaeta ligniaria NRRL 30616 TaxID=1408157 RepID=A0A1J7JFQ3_9PEZI|nr:hypothetical protein CONLIGDRAFT_706716 [Coniochaeta ligniaria NRRL 30616]